MSLAAVYELENHLVLLEVQNIKLINLLVHNIALSICLQNILQTFYSRIRFIATHGVTRPKIQI